LVGLIAATAIVVVVVRRLVSVAEEKRRSKAPVRPGHEYERHRID
jgi:hypothetical protein